VQNHTDKIRDYLLLVGNQVDPVTAATRAFGDLKQLQSALDGYIAQSVFNSFKLTKALPLDDGKMQVQPITSVQADAVRADFLAYIQREKDSRNLLEQVLHDDPNNTLAHETMGYLEFRAGHLDKAQDWYQRAVTLDSQSYLANYYFATMAMNRGQSGADIDGQIETCLRKAIRLNPSFAPPYDRLAVFYGVRHKNLDEAHMLTLQAVELDPGNLNFRLNAANVLLTMQREKDATAVLQATLKLAKKPEEVMEVQNALQAVQQSTTKQNAEEAGQFHEAITESKESEAEAVEPDTPQKKESLSGPHRTITGTIKNVRCSAPATMDVDVEAAGKTIALHARNYYKVQFGTLDYTPKPEFQPCSDLEGKHAKVEYIESIVTKTNGLVAIELHQ
jgi:tetratricopeptide (TPR) repeat protein